MYPCTICDCPDFVEGNILISTVCARPTCLHDMGAHGIPDGTGGGGDGGGGGDIKTVKASMTMIPDETRYYFTEKIFPLPAGGRPTLAREDGTKWVQDSDCQVLPLDGTFSEEEMAEYRRGKFRTHGELKRDYETHFGPGSAYGLF